ncbi:ribosome biogenesis GTPase YqeH [Erysipelotrichaceae bacterium]|nr:ribosome biogenesis GTPase YqeH [Erysipelotrichaceae bacterium]
MNETKYCKGCGIALQSSNSEGLGYILEKHIEIGKCKRCFRIQQYSDFQVVDIKNEELYEMMDAIVATDAYIIHMLDITDLLGSAIFEASASLKKKPCLIVVNKIDVIDRNMRRYDHWHEYCSEIFAKHGIKVKDILFVSAKEILGIQFLLKYLKKEAGNKPIHIIGSANVGKSSLIQAFFQENGLETKQTPIISPIPGTTLKALEIQCSDFTLFDTPGIMKPQQFTYHLQPSALKEVTLLKQIRPRNYPIYEEQTFFIGGYAQINIKPKGTNSVTFYMNQQLEIHRRKTAGSDDFFKTHLGGILSPPYAENGVIDEKFFNRATTIIKVKQAKTDIVISGLGWISIKNSDVEVEVITLPKVMIYKKNALV